MALQHIQPHVWTPASDVHMLAPVGIFDGVHADQGRDRARGLTR